MSKINSATMEDLVRANKVLKKAKEKEIILKFPKLQVENVRFVTYHDASYADIENEGSQRFHAIFWLMTMEMQLQYLGSQIV